MRAAEATEIMATLRHFAASLADSEDELNAINVFPVADRDTGTNLRRTVEAMIDELDGVEPTAELASAVALAALNGARGNSGLICAQFLAGMLAVEPDALLTDAATLARSLAAGAARARAAVANPVDGTMVSVADAAARTAAEHSSGSPTQLLDAVQRTVQWAVDDTRRQLPVLTEAGVVDAGAAGLGLFFEAIAAIVAHAESGAEAEPVDGGVAALVWDTDVAPLPIPHSSPTHEPASRFVGFEVQFTANGDQAVADALRALLHRAGTDVVVSHADTVIRAHVHTGEAGPVIEAVLAHVEPRNIGVEPLFESTRPDGTPHP